MLFKIICVLMVLFSCNAMEQKVYDITFSVETEDKQVIDIPTEFIKYSTTIKNMVEDFGGSRDVKIPMSLTARALRALITLAEQHANNEDEANNAVSMILKDSSIMDSVHLLLAANYLDCKVFMMPILMALCEKIHNAIIESKTDSIDFSAELLEIWQELENILPEELQMLVKKCLFYNYGVLNYFMKEIQFPHRKNGSFKGITAVTGFKNRENYTVFHYNDHGFEIFDRSTLPVRKIGSFNMRDKPSPDGKYMATENHNKRTINIVDLSSGRTGTIKGHNGEFIPNTSLYVSDTGAGFDLESWQKLRKNARILKDVEKVTSKPHFRRHGLIGYNCQDQNMGFWHPEFMKLKDKKDVDVICSQLPTEIQKYPFDLGLYRNTHEKVCVSKNCKWATFGYIRDFSTPNKKQVLDVYDISNVKDIVLHLSFDGVVGFSLYKDFLFVATRTKVEKIDLQKKCTVWSKDMRVDAISFDVDGFSFIVMEIERVKLQKMTAYFYVRSLDTFFEFAFSTDGGDEPILFCNLLHELLVKEQGTELDLIEMPMRILMQNLKELIILSRKNFFERLGGATRENGTHKKEDDVEPKRKKRNRNEDEDGNERPRRRARKE